VKALVIALPLLAVLLAGCANPSPDLATSYHPVTGLRTDMMKDNLLEAGPPAREVVWLNALRVFRSDSTYNYYLEVVYAAPAQAGYLDLKSGPSLRLEADGKALLFNGEGSRLDRRKGKELAGEKALYLVKAGDLRTIAAAQRVAVQITGKNGSVAREFAARNSDRFRKFVERFVSAP
jgi:hypothetical protein